LGYHSMTKGNWLDNHDKPNVGSFTLSKKKTRLQRWGPRRVEVRLEGSHPFDWGAGPVAVVGGRTSKIGGGKKKGRQK